jgi:hypothetical protein
MLSLPKHLADMSAVTQRAVDCPHIRRSVNRMSIYQVIVLLSLLTGAALASEAKRMTPGKWISVASAVDVKGLKQYGEGAVLGSIHDVSPDIDSILAANWPAIEKNRTTVITLKTAPGAAVSVKQTRHAFEFGTAISRRAFVPNNSVSESDREQYKRVLKANFNSVVHENAMKWYSNERQRDKITYADAETMLAWCEANALSTRGHCVYWGRDKLVQQWLRDLDNEALRDEIKQRASDYMGRFKGRVREYDVNNEMVHCHYYKKRLGRGIREQMFEWCHAYDPEAVLYVKGIKGTGP